MIFEYKTYMILILLILNIGFSVSSLIEPKCCTCSTLRYPICTGGERLFNVTFQNGVPVHHTRILQKHVVSNISRIFEVGQDIVYYLDPRFGCTQPWRALNGTNRVLVNCTMEQKYFDELNNPAPIYDYCMCSYKVGLLSAVFQNYIKKRENVNDPIAYGSDELLLDVVVNDREFRVNWGGELPIEINVKRADNKWEFKWTMSERLNYLTLPTSEIFDAATYIFFAKTQGKIIKTTVSTQPTYACHYSEDGKQIIAEFASCQYQYNSRLLDKFLYVIIALFLIWFFWRFSVIKNTFLFFLSVIEFIMKMRIFVFFIKTIRYAFQRVEDFPKKETKFSDIESQDVKDKDIYLTTSEKEKMINNYEKEFEEDPSLRNPKAYFDDTMKGGFITENNSICISKERNMDTLKQIKESSESDIIQSDKKKPRFLIIKKKALKPNNKIKNYFEKNANKKINTSFGLFKILLVLLLINPSYQLCSKNFEMASTSRFCNDDSQKTCFEYLQVSAKFTDIGETMCIVGKDSSQKSRISITLELVDSYLEIYHKESYKTSEFHLQSKQAVHCRWTIFQHKDVCYGDCSMRGGCLAQPILNSAKLDPVCESGCLTGIDMTGNSCFYSDGCLAYDFSVIPSGASFQVLRDFNFVRVNVLTMKIEKEGQTTLKTLTLRSNTEYDEPDQSVSIESVNLPIYNNLEEKCIIHSETDQILSSGKQIKKDSFFISECNKLGTLSCDKIGCLQIISGNDYNYDTACIKKKMTAGKYIYQYPQPLVDFMRDALDYSQNKYGPDTITFINRTAIRSTTVGSIYENILVKANISYSSIIQNNNHATLDFIDGSMRGYYGKSGSPPYFKIKVTSMSGQVLCSLSSKQISVLTNSVNIKTNFEEFTISFLALSKDVDVSVDYECSGLTKTFQIKGNLIFYEPTKTNSTATVSTNVVNDNTQTTIPIGINFKDLKNGIITGGIIAVSGLLVVIVFLIFK